MPQNIDLKTKEKIISTVNQILAITKDADYLDNPAKQTQVKEYEEQIDQMVYDLYAWPREIRLVEGKNNEIQSRHPSSQIYSIARIWLFSIRWIFYNHLHPSTAMFVWNVQLDEYVVMPNHIHGIVVINESVVGAIHELSLRNELPPSRERRRNRIIHCSAATLYSRTYNELTACGTTLLYNNLTNLLKTK